MSISQCHVFWSSPCGGTAAVARAVAAGLSLPVVEHDVTRGSAPVQLGKDDVAIFAAPVYAGKTPAFSLKALARAHGDGTPAVLVAVYGNREFEEALFDLNALAVKNGFAPIAAIAGIAEHSMFGKVASGRPNAADKEGLGDFGRRIAVKLAGVMKPLEEIPGIRIEPKALPIEVIGPTVDDGKCTLCGKCVAVCPGHAISITTVSTTDFAKCVGCQACIHVCPEGARYLGHQMIPAMRERMETNCAVPKDNQLWL